MMANRVVRDGVLDSERYLGLAHDSERLLFLELLLLADDFGLVPTNFIFLSRKAASCLGKGDGAVAAMVSALADKDLLRCYTSESDTRHGWIPRFRNPPRARKPKFALPPRTPAFEEVHKLIESRALAEGEDILTEGGGKKGAVPTCPHKEIVDLYMQILGKSLGEVRSWHDARRKALHARWEWVAKRKGWTSAEEGVEWFKLFFEAVTEDDFLMGRTKPGQGHANWRATIDYLLSPKGFLRVFEGHGRRQAVAA
jgi:hypothetical protein